MAIEKRSFAFEVMHFSNIWRRTLSMQFSSLFSEGGEFAAAALLSFALQSSFLKGR